MNNSKENGMEQQLLRVLVAEDNQDDATLVLHHLNENGFNTEASIVADAAGFNRQLGYPWDIIFCDYSMPGFSPRAALEILREKQLNTPLIIISGNISQSQAASLMLSGARDFVDKDNLSRLIPAINRELSVSRLQREKRDIEQHIAHLAYFDEATALPNENYFTKTLQELVSVPGEQAYLIAHINLNRLSMIADMHGNATRNAIVREVATRMHQLDDSSLFARLGANDFSLLIAHRGDCDSCIDTGGNIQRLFTRPFVVDKREHFLTPTLGISCYPCQGESAGKVMRNAKYAMQHACRQQLPAQHYDIAIEKENVERVIISDRLPGAIKRDEFSLFYQPKLHTRSRKVTALEVLLRWNDGQLGKVSPARFIPIAEETGDIMAIGLWVLRQACSQAYQWRTRGVFDGKIAVNLSMRQLRDAGFADTVRAILAETGFPASHLELEITETDIMQDSELSIAILRQLQALGIALVIDDFGTGYSSLSYLKRLPIRCLKIDRAFISDIDKRKDSMAIVEAILALARSLKLEVVAEGVETAGQMELLRGLACDEVQGYYISRPQDSDAIARFITEYHRGATASATN